MLISAVSLAVLPGKHLYSTAIKNEQKQPIFVLPDLIELQIIMCMTEIGLFVLIQWAWDRKEISLGGGGGGGAENNLLNVLCQQYVQHLKHMLQKTQSY